MYLLDPFGNFSFDLSLPYERAAAIELLSMAAAGTQYEF